MPPETETQPTQNLEVAEVAAENATETKTEVAPGPEETQKLSIVEDKKEEPVAEKKQQQKEEETKEEQSLDFFIKRIGELETEKKELSSLIASLKEQENQRQAEQVRLEAQRKTDARTKLLTDEYKILKDEYMQLAPSVDNADPTTDEGKEALRQWVNSNPGLFGKAPELPKTEGRPSDSTGLFGKSGWRWADKWKS